MKTQSPPYRLGSAGLDLIKASESLELLAYLCPANKLTIGYGHVINAQRDWVLFKSFDRAALQALIDACQRSGKLSTDAKARLFINPTQAEALIQADTQQVAAFISSISRADLTPNQFDALVSLVFNIGQRNYAESTLRAKLGASAFVGAAKEFERWVYATVKGQKVQLPGLVTRRAAERALFERP